MAKWGLYHWCQSIKYCMWLRETCISVCGTLCTFFIFLLYGAKTKPLPSDLSSEMDHPQRVKRCRFNVQLNRNRYIILPELFEINTWVFSPRSKFLCLWQRYVWDSCTVNLTRYSLANGLYDRLTLASVLTAVCVECQLYVCLFILFTFCLWYRYVQIFTNVFLM